MSAEGGAKEVISVGDVRQIFFQLVEVELAAKLYVVGSNGFAEVIHHLVDVVDQLVRPAGNADDKAVEVDLWNALDTRRAGKNAGSAVGAGSEAQVGQARLLAAQWLVQRGIESKIAQAKLVDASRRRSSW